MRLHARFLGAGLLGGLLFAGAPALAEDASSPAAPAAPDAQEMTPVARDVKNETPILTYTYQASGAPAKTVGVQAYGLMGTNNGSSQKGLVGGGFTVWGSPVDRLTLVGDGARDLFGNFAPSAAGIVRVLGRANDGFSLGVLGKFKVEGFGVGPNDEIESEVESGLLLSYARAGWHADLNGITGFGLGDDGEIDVEGRLRLGRELGEWVRIGVDGQARYRAAGDFKLPGPQVGQLARKGDFAGGPQIMVGGGHFFGALTAGPTTMNVFSNVGFTAVATLGGATL